MHMVSVGFMCAFKVCSVNFYKSSWGETMLVIGLKGVDDGVIL